MFLGRCKLKIDNNINIKISHLDIINYKFKQKLENKMGENFVIFL